MYDQLDIWVSLSERQNKGLTLDGCLCAVMMCGVYPYTFFDYPLDAAIPALLFLLVCVCVCAWFSLFPVCFPTNKGASGGSMKDGRKFEHSELRAPKCINWAERSWFIQVHEEISYFVCGQIVSPDIYRVVCSVGDNFIFSELIEGINSGSVGLSWNAGYLFRKGFFHNQNDFLFVSFMAASSDCLQWKWEYDNHLCSLKSHPECLAALASKWRFG